MTRSKKRKINQNVPAPVDYGDLPREELMRRAGIAASLGWSVRFKFTCSTCGGRCAFAEINKLWTQGECAACGRMTDVVQGGFMLLACSPTKVMMDWVMLPEEIRFSETLFPPIAA